MHTMVLQILVGISFLYFLCWYNQLKHFDLTGWNNLSKYQVKSSELTFFIILFTKLDAIDIADPSSMQDAFHKCVSLWLCVSEPRNQKVWSSVPHRDSDFFCSKLMIRWNNIFLYFFTELKTYHLSYCTWNNLFFHLQIFLLLLLRDILVPYKLHWTWNFCMRKWTSLRLPLKELMDSFLILI